MRMWISKPPKKLKDFEIGTVIEIKGWFNRPFFIAERNNGYTYMWKSEKDYINLKPWVLMLSDGYIIKRGYARCNG